MMIHQHCLNNGRVKKLVTSPLSIQTSSASLADSFASKRSTFAANALRIRYPKFRREHLFVRAGVIEAACKAVIPTPVRTRT
jgi:hypothetical protein